MCVIYRYHDLQKQEFIELKTFCKLNKKYCNHVVVGDFNIDVMKSDLHTENYIQNRLEREYLQMINPVTRARDMGSRSCIDSIFMKQKCRLPIL